MVSRCRCTLMIMRLSEDRMEMLFACMTHEAGGVFNLASTFLKPQFNQGMRKDDTAAVPTNTAAHTDYKQHCALELVNNVTIIWRKEA